MSAYRVWFIGLERKGGGIGIRDGFAVTFDATSPEHAEAQAREQFLVDRISKIVLQDDAPAEGR